MTARGRGVDAATARNAPLPVQAGSVTVAGASIPAAVPRAECQCVGARSDQTGTLDGEACVLELKTGKSLQRSYALQLAGQALTLGGCREPSQPLWVPNLRARLLLQLRADGTFEARRDLHRYDDPADFAAVRCAAAHAHHRLRYGAKLSEESRHSFHRPDGTRVPSISAILSLGAYVDLRDIPPAILEAAALRGKYVHEAIEYLCADDLDMASVAPALAGYVVSYQRFREETGWRATGVEVEGVYVCPAHRDA